MVVSSFAKFVTPASVSFVTFWAWSEATANAKSRTGTAAYRFIMMGAMVGQPRHEALHGHMSRLNCRRLLAAGADTAAIRDADCDGGTADRGKRHDEGGLGISA